MYHCFQRKHDCVSSVKSCQSSLSGTKPFFTGIQVDYFTIPDIDNSKKKKYSHFKIQSLVCPFPTQAPSPTNSSRAWVECINNRDQAPPNSCAPKRKKKINHAICRQLPGLVFQGWLQAKHMKISQTSHILSQNWPIAGAKYMVELPDNEGFLGKKQLKIPTKPKPHWFLPFLGKYYLYLGFYTSSSHGWAKSVTC